MDNIIDYLVVIFFVVSFLSSLFKKKKKKPVQPKGNETPKRINRERVPVKTEKASNPFDEFFKSLNEELVVEKKNVTRSEVDEYYEQALQNSDNSESVVESSSSLSDSSPLIPESISETKESSSLIKSYTESVDL